MNDASIPVENLKAEVVIFHACRDIGVAIELEGFAGFPAGIEDAEIDVRVHGGFARSTCEPGLHIAGRANGALFIKDRDDGQSIFKADGLPQMLNDLRHIQGVEDTPADFVLAKEWR